MLPWTKIVHLVRDGRDVALSVRDRGRRQAGSGLAALDPIVAAALSWRRDVAAVCSDGLDAGPTRYLEIRYENLVTEPEVTLKVIAGFLGLPFRDEMLEYFRGAAPDRADPSSRAAWLPATPGLRDWRTQMTTQECELFEALAGAELESLGYERRFPRISGEVARVASQWEARLARELQ
jgi:hypothetical protein